MRNLFFLILFIASDLIFGQTKQFLITDTSAIRLSIQREDTPTDTLPITTYDTNYYFNETIIKKGGHLIGYYDKSFKKKALETTFDSNGKQIGYRDRWYRNGQKKEHWKDTIYVKDFNFYDVTQWYSDGKIKHRNVYNGKDSTTSFYYYNNGNVKMIEKEFYDLSLSHQVYCYHESHFENGQLCNTPLIDNWLKKSQPVTFFFSNGKTKISYTMFQMELFGEYKEWNKNGILIISGQYKNPPNSEEIETHIWREGVKVGKWTFFTDKGELKGEELYNDKGELISTTNK